MKTISRYIMTLALLITAVTGAWAQVVLWDGTGKEIGSDGGFWDRAQPTVIDDNGNQIIKFTITKNPSGWEHQHHNAALPVIDSDFKSLRRLTFRMKMTDSHNVLVQLIGKDDSYTIERSATYDGGDRWQEMVFEFGEGVDYDKITDTGNYLLTIWPYEMTADGEGKNFYLDDIKLVPDAGIEVTTNAASEGATFTEAWFNMPAYDATAEYELVRDMAVDMPVTIGDGKDGYRVRVEKADGKWKLADMTDAELMAKVKVRDSIEHKDLVFYGNDAVCGLKIYALSAEGKPTGDPITKATMAPGSFVIVATAKEGSAYEGTSTSNTFELYVKSDLTLSASNYTIESGAATIKVDGTDKSAAIAEGKLAGIEMGAKVSLAANTAYVMSDVTVTSGDNKVTITTADGVSSFTMPDSAATMAYTIKRDITQKVTIQIADRVRLEKKDGKYDAVDPFELIPILTDKIGETDKNMFLGEATGTSGDFYIKGMQKLDGENWVDATELNIGTYRVVIAGMLNYDGTIYTDPIELYMGYEITVAAGEYASYYSAEALTTEDADAELYTIASVTDTEAVLSDKIKVAPKETPLLVYNKSEESKTFLLIPTTETADEVTVAKEFKGSLTEGEIPASSAVTDYYALNGKAFVWVKYAIEIGANKCWLQIGDQPAAARAMTRSIVGGGDTTNMDDVRWQMEDGNYYDLQGRKVQGKPNKNGVYIKNGKKVIFK